MDELPLIVYRGIDCRKCGGHRTASFVRKVDGDTEHGEIPDRLIFRCGNCKAIIYVNEFTHGD